MSDERFAWSRVDKVTGAFELRKRNVTRTLIKDSDLICLVCGRKPKREDVCYYPATGLSPANKIIAHKECADSLCAEHTAKSAQEHREAEMKERRLIQMPSMAPAEAGSDLLTQIERLYLDAYNRGLEDGRKAAFIEALNRLETLIPAKDARRA